MTYILPWFLKIFHVSFCEASIKTFLWYRNDPSLRKIKWTRFTEKMRSDLINLRVAKNRTLTRFCRVFLKISPTFYAVAGLGAQTAQAFRHEPRASAAPRTATFLLISTFTGFSGHYRVLAVILSSFPMFDQVSLSSTRLQGLNRTWLGFTAWLLDFT